MLNTMAAEIEAARLADIRAEWQEWLAKFKAIPFVAEVEDVSAKKMSVRIVLSNERALRLDVGFPRLISPQARPDRIFALWPSPKEEEIYHEWDDVMRRLNFYSTY